VSCLRGGWRMESAGAERMGTLLRAGHARIEGDTGGHTRLSARRVLHQSRIGNALAARLASPSLYHPCSLPRQSLVTSHLSLSCAKAGQAAG
jgi:hypothetical protein